MPRQNQLFREQAVAAQNVMNGRIRVAPSPGWTRINLLLIGSVSIAVIFASLATYSRTVPIQGAIQTEEGTAVVRAREQGAILLSVKIGDKVTDGQKIAEIKIERQDETGDLALQRQNALRSEIMMAQTRANAAREAGVSMAEAANMRANAALNRIETLNAQLDQARIQTQAAQIDLDRAREIAKKGFLSKRDLEARESAVASRRQQEAEILERISAARGDAASARAEASQAISMSIAEEANAMESSSRAQLMQSESATSSTNVYVSQSAGIVASLPYRSGQVVQQGQVVGVVMPENAKLIATFEIPSDKMAEVREGQVVRIAVDAYPYEKFGVLEGKVRSVSLAAIPNGEKAIYLVEAEMPQIITAYGRQERLLPGMTITARIKTQERTLIQWLLDPILAVSER